MLPLILSSDSHMFEPLDLWQTRIDRAFRDRAPRIERVGVSDYIVVEADQILSGIGLISNAGARFAAPETISAEVRFEDVRRGGYDPEQHLENMALDSPHRLTPHLESKLVKQNPVGRSISPRAADLAAAG